MSRKRECDFDQSALVSATDNASAGADLGSGAHVLAGFSVAPAAAAGRQKDDRDQHDREQSQVGVTGVHVQGYGPRPGLVSGAASRTAAAKLLAVETACVVRIV